MNFPWNKRTKGPQIRLPELFVTEDGAIWELDEHGWDSRLVRPAKTPTCPHCRVALSAREHLRAGHVSACAVWG